MTTSNLMSLPINIAWKWLDSSEDMMDKAYGNRYFPLKWKTSLSLFYYQPISDEDLYPESTITYLKVVCSITGYQADGKELGVKIENSKEWNTRVYRNFNTLIKTYYPCYGALLQVTVHPGRQNSNVPLSKYPHFIDFTPKKREIFEIVTKSGEMLSRSSTIAKVGKNSTSAESMETSAIEKGGMGGSYAGYGVSLGAEETGYRAGVRGENVIIRSIDDSREKRESFSHTTNLTQMYHLLDSYHLGTNRALFALFPRPHIVDVDVSVTNGLRRLEGIQEFFLIVEQPKDIKKLCFEAHLETSHLHKSTRTRTTGTTQYKKGKIKQRISDSSEDDVKRTYRIYVPDSLHNKVDRSRGNGGYEETVVQGDNVTEDIQSHSVQVFDDHILVEVTYDPDPVWPFSDTAYFTADYIVYYVSKNPTKTPSKTEVEDVTLFMTGRYLASCLAADEDGVWVPERGSIAHARIPSGYITFEEPLSSKYWVAATSGKESAAESASQQTALVNELQEYIKDRVVESVHDPDRYAIGTCSFMESDFTTRYLLRSAADSGFAPQAYAENVVIPNDLGRKLNAQDRQRLTATTVAEILQKPTRDIARILNIKSRDVFDLKLINLGVSLVKKNVHGNQEETVPDLVGISLDEAKARIEANRLRVGEIAYHDSEQPKDATLSQYPDVGTKLAKGQVVSLIVSNGPAIIPDVVGMNEEGASEKMKALSLRVAVSTVVSKEHAIGTVLETTPKAGTTVPKNSQVVLLVVRKEESQ